jgi:hypothetical protein
VNWCNKDEESRWWQIVRCRCCRVGDAHSTDFISPFVSPFIKIFLSFLHLLSLAAILPAWQLWNTSRSHPTSTPHDTFYVMISVTFKSEGKFSFLLQVDVAGDRAGDGSTKTSIKMNTKWLCNTCRSHPTSTPLHDTFYLMISVTFECEGHANWPFLLQVDVAG